MKLKVSKEENKVIPFEEFSADFQEDKLSPEALNELKEALEETARTTDIKGMGATAILKTPEQIETDNLIKEWKTTKTDDISVPEFKIPKQLIKVITQTKQFSCLILYGEGGLGKTVLTLSETKSLMNPDDWVYINGYTTPLALFETLYDNRAKKLIIIDDVEGLFKNKISVSILKGAIWDSNGARIVQYASKSEKATTPKEFIMEAQIIILCNTLPTHNEETTTDKDRDLKALISRAITHEVSFSYVQKLNICNRFLEQNNLLNPVQKKEVSTLLSTYTNEATISFNFRTLRKAIAFVLWDNKEAGDLFRATTQQDFILEAYIQVEKESSTVLEQINRFYEITGKSRRTFFRIKQELKRKCQSATN